MSSNGRILIIDDNTKNLEILANILNANNYDIEIGINGYEVFNWLKNDTFDLLLLDVMMPEIDGFEVCSKIREDHKFDLLPVIFISAKSDSQSMVRGFEVGGQDYISKPFDHAELLARVKTHIELKKSKENLKTLNAHLEQRINQRTKELNIANQKLMNLGITKDRFLSFISGEVSTPLVSMSKVLDVIKHSSESSRMAEMITLLDQSVNKLERVSEMASFITQISTTKTSTEKNSFSLINSIDYILMDLNEALDKKNLELDMDLDDKIRG
ncbi:MAG: response regulator [Marinilabiliaceae bacterium]|nr:response regulator [Marinilabiliaceae bacterium]